MVPVTTLLAVAATWWGGLAPGVAEQNCPDGVRYNVRTEQQMELKGTRYVAESRLGSCVISFKAGALASYTPEDDCLLVLHEYGHAAIGRAAGGPHADANGHAPSGLMAEWIDWEHPPGICFGLRQARHARRRLEPPPLRFLDQRVIVKA
jgi:hypothetical protein